MPYHLLLEIVRALLGVPASVDDEVAREQLSKALRDLLGEAAADVDLYLAHLLALPLEAATANRVQGLDPAALQARYLGALRQVLLTSARSGPLAVVCEDVHWADGASVAALSKLFPVVDEAPLLIVFTSREERAGPGWELVTELRRRFGDGLVDLRLRSLSESDSRRLVQSLLELDELPEELAAVVVSRSEGNPLFVEEILHSLIERRLLSRGAGGWTLEGDLTDLDIPDSIHGLLLARIDRLPEKARDVVKVAAVIGRRFSLRVIDVVLERLGLVEGRAELGVLEGAGLIEVATVEPVLEYAFRHPLLHEAAYRSLLRQQRRRLHGVVGEALAEVVGDRVGELAAMLAAHFEQAGDTDRAVDYLIAAGDHSLQRLANREAVAFYQRAFDAREVYRNLAEDGRRLMHSHLKINGESVMLSDEFPEFTGREADHPAGVTIHLEVDDADAWWSRAVEAGAEVKMPVEDQFWGDRYGKVADPFGHEWQIATHIEDLTPEEMQKRGAEAMASMS